MDFFIKNIQIGLFHVLDSNALDHLFYLFVLIIPFTYKNWKKALFTISFFTIAHTITLFLATYNSIHYSSSLIETLIPITIIFTALFNIFSRKDSNTKYQYLSAFAFGLIHGLGFSSGFRMLFGRVQNKAALVIEFALGIELAQLVLAISLFLVNYIVLDLIVTNQKLWVRITSSLILIATVLLFF